MKRKLLLFVILVAALGCLALSACDDPPIYLGTEVVPPPEFSDTVLQYDGTPKSIAVKGLPEGSKVEYTYKKDGVKVAAEDVVELGTYEVTAKIITPAKYNPVRPMKANLTIEKGVIDTSGAYFDINSATYTGTDIECELLGLPEGVFADYTYIDSKENEIPAMIHAGEYTVIATLYAEDGAHYKIDENGVTKKTTFTVEKAKVDFSNLKQSFYNKTATYTGREIAYPTVSGIKNVNVKYSITKNGASVSKIVGAGEYKVIATFASNNGDYTVAEADATKTVTVTVNKASINVSGVTLENGETVYNGMPAELLVQGLPEGVNVSYSYASGNELREAMITAGEYTVTATLSPADPANYMLTGAATKTATLLIKKQVVDISSVIFEAGTAVYTGERLTHEAATGFDPAIFDVSYTYIRGMQAQDMVNAGEYRVIAKFTLKNTVNYELQGEDTCEALFTVTKKVIDLSDIIFADGEALYDPDAPTTEYTHVVSGEIPAGFTVSYRYELNGEAVSAMCGIGKYTVIATFTPDDLVNYEICELISTFAIKEHLSDEAFAGIGFADGEAEYSGEEQVFGVTGLPADIEVAYTYILLDAEGNDLCEVKALINAGKYRVVATFTSSRYDLADAQQSMKAFFTIGKKRVDLGGVVFEGKDVIYNGEEQPYDEANGADLFDVTYTVDGNRVNAGSFTVTATFALKDADNYEFVGADNTITVTYTIAKREISLSDVVFAGKTVTYNGNAWECIATNIPDLVSVMYTYMLNGVEVPEIKGAGVYTVTATFKPLDEENNAINGETVLSVEYEVEKQQVMLTEVYFPHTSAVYDKTQKLCNPAKVDHGIFNFVCEYFLVGFDGSLMPVEEMVNAGMYHVVVTFSLVDENNYAIFGSSVKRTDFLIEKAEVDLSAVAFPEINYAPYTEGETYTYELENLPEEIFAFYTYNGSYDPMAQIGEYTVIAYLWSDNYNIPAEYSAIEATYVVQQRIPLGGIAFSPVKEAVYTGSPIVPELVNLPAGVVPRFVYVDAQGNVLTEIVDAGVYSVYVTFERDGDIYYYVDPTYQLPVETYTIHPKTVAFDFTNGSAVYDGTAKTHTGVTFNLPEGIEIVYTYYLGESTQTVDAMIADGVYRVEATLIGDNYVFANGTTTVSVTFEILNTGV